MVPRTLRILRIYWSRLQMAEKSGSHCGPAFQIHWGVTQGYPLSPTIFNVGVGACIRDWVVVVGGGGQEGARKGLTVSIQTLLALFCVNDELVASPESASLQGVFDALTGLFDRLGLRTNRGGMAIMACRPFHIPHTWSTEACNWQVKGRGIFYR